MISAKKILFLGLMLAFLLAAAGCSPAQPTLEPTVEKPVETEEASLPPTEAATATPTEEESAEETETTEEPGDSENDQARSPEEISACVECHSDQGMLIDTAAPVEEVESENEGAG